MTGTPSPPLRIMVGHLLQVYLHQIEACFHAVDVRTAVSSQRTAGGIAGSFLPVAVPVVHIGPELELAVQPQDGFILSEPVAMEGMRLAPAALVANLIDELVEAHRLGRPRLVKHVEGDVIEQGIGIGSNHEVTALIAVVELAFFFGSSQTAAPVTAKTALRSHLELHVTTILRGSDTQLEDRVLVRVAPVVRQLIRRVGVVPSVNSTCEVVG